MSDEIKELLDSIDESLMQSQEEADNNEDEFVHIIEDSEITDTPIPEAELKQAEKIITVNEEIAQFNKEVLGKLESPLIVHKKSDASYEDTASSQEMSETHTEEERPNLIRHRFRKDKKKKNHWALPIIIIVVAAAVFTGLYFSGILSPQKEERTTADTNSSAETTTTLQQAYEGKIVIKNTYIFVDGVEVNGIEGLQNALKYVDPSPTAYEIVKEDANADFLNNDVLPLMLDMGFYDESTVISTTASTGLIAQEETPETSPSPTDQPTDQPAETPVTEGTSE